MKSICSYYIINDALNPIMIKACCRDVWMHDQFFHPFEVNAGNYIRRKKKVFVLRLFPVFIYWLFSKEKGCANIIISLAFITNYMLANKLSLSLSSKKNEYFNFLSLSSLIIWLCSLSIVDLSIRLSVGTRTIFFDLILHWLLKLITSIILLIQSSYRFFSFNHLITRRKKDEISIHSEFFQRS